MTDRCREKRTAALRRLIEEAEASGISECSIEEVFAEARALSDERRGQGTRRFTLEAAGGRPEAEKVKEIRVPFGQN